MSVNLSVSYLPLTYNPEIVQFVCYILTSFQNYLACYPYLRGTKNKILYVDIVMFYLIMTISKIAIKIQNRYLYLHVHCMNLSYL